MKAFSTLLSAAIVLFGEGAYAQAANPTQSNPLENNTNGDSVAQQPGGGAAASAAAQEELPYDASKDDPTGILPPQNAEDDPAWFRQNMDDVPCYKLAEEGLYDLGTLKNQMDDWHVTDHFGNKLSFNFCHYTDNSLCDGAGDNFGHIVTPQGSCSELTSDSPTAEIIEASSRTSLTDPSDT